MHHGDTDTSCISPILVYPPIQLHSALCLPLTLLSHPFYILSIMEKERPFSFLAREQDRLMQREEAIQAAKDPNRFQVGEREGGRGPVEGSK